MKWKPLNENTSSILFLETPIGTFFIVISHVCMVITPHSIWWDEQFDTLDAAKAAVERYINGLAAELSEGIWE